MKAPRASRKPASRRLTSGAEGALRGRSGMLREDQAPAPTGRRCRKRRRRATNINCQRSSPAGMTETEGLLQLADRLLWRSATELAVLGRRRSRTGPGRCWSRSLGRHSLVLLTLCSCQETSAQPEELFRVNHAPVTGAACRIRVRDSSRPPTPAQSPNTPPASRAARSSEHHSGRGLYAPWCACISACLVTCLTTC
jgi:hypothetical protein